MLLVPSVNKGFRLLTGQLCLVELVAWGTLYYTFSVFLAPMGADLGWSKATLAFGFSTALIVSGLAAPLVGRWIDRHGSREIMSLGILVGAAGLALWSESTSLPIYLAAWVLIGLGMAGSLYAPAFATLVCFDKETHRNGILIVTLVGALAATIFFPTSTFLIGSLGWRAALMVLAGGLVLLALPGTLLIPRVNREEDCEPEVRENPIVKAPKSFALVATSMTLVDFAGAAINVYLIVFLLEQGHTGQAAAAIAGIAGIAKIVGRFVTVFGERVSPVMLYRASLFVTASAVLLPLVWPTTWAVVVMVVAFGSMGGARTILRPLMIVELFGRQSFGTSNGLVQMFVTVGTSSAPVAMGLLVAMLGWQLSWGIGALIIFISGALLTLVPRVNKTIDNLESADGIGVANG
ncbi:MAG: MFS transporter [Pseudomonadota bacterium]